ncbi:MAG: hypothetical protein Q7J57_06915 [Gemmobacter sp.]|nr:hypothetical protein [Gemmobacter sp.]
MGAAICTFGGTITATDIVNLVSVAGMLELRFVDAGSRAGHSAIPGRPAPATLVLALSEGLVPNATVQGTGLALLAMDLSVKAPVPQGDTVHVDLHVTEQRATSRLGRGLVRTRNEVVNQRGEVMMVAPPHDRWRARRSTLWPDPETTVHIAVQSGGAKCGVPWFCAKWRIFSEIRS